MFQEFDVRHNSGVTAAAAVDVENSLGQVEVTLVNLGQR
jgi:hypothetical protein